MVLQSTRRAMLMVLLQAYGEYLEQVLGDTTEAKRYYKLASEIVTL